MADAAKAICQFKMVAQEQIIGADQLTSRFGGWPAFHDAEVMHLEFDRQGPNLEVVIHTWVMTNKVDDRGCYVRAKHTLVRIRFEHVESNEFSGFNNQNVLFALSIEPKVVVGVPGYRVAFESSYGLSGYVTCTRIIIVAVMPCDDQGNLANKFEG